MFESKEVLEANKQSYENRYAKEEAFLRYPADWIVRFHHLYMKKNSPSGRVLDYGCGSGNNSIFFVEKGYEVYGVDVAPAARSLVALNLKSRYLDERLAERFSTISPEWKKLPFSDNYFNLILSNQVLYYLPSKESIQSACKEFSRCLMPGGVVFFTMMGPRNYYVQDYAVKVHGNIHEIRITAPDHRLSGVKEMIYVVQTEDELKNLFSEFECIDVGYLEHKMLDLKNTHHWIYIGKKRS